MESNLLNKHINIFEDSLRNNYHWRLEKLKGASYIHGEMHNVVKMYLKKKKFCKDMQTEM